MEPGSSRSPARAGLPITSPPVWRPDIIVAEPAWRRLVPQAEAIVARAARAAGLAGSIVLASDSTVKRLNARHRGRNKPTNVLTFEAPSTNPGWTAGGEVILALGVVRREALQSGKRAGHHLAHLVVHGALHLRGHDHHHAGEARRMEMEETRILRRLGLPNPWKRI
jgi:probable rRNA maturation factor